MKAAVMLESSLKEIILQEPYASQLLINRL